MEGTVTRREEAHEAFGFEERQDAQTSERGQALQQASQEEDSAQSRPRENAKEVMPLATQAVSEDGKETDGWPEEGKGVSEGHIFGEKMDTDGDG